MSIAAAALTGEVFKADARKVHQIVVGLTADGTAATWIKPLEKKQNGRLDMKAL